MESNNAPKERKFFKRRRSTTLDRCVKVCRDSRQVHVSLSLFLFPLTKFQVAERDLIWASFAQLLKGAAQSLSSPLSSSSPFYSCIQQCPQSYLLLYTTRTYMLHARIDKGITKYHLVLSIGSNPKPTRKVSPKQ